MPTGVYKRTPEMRDNKGRFVAGLKTKKWCLTCGKEFETLVNSKHKYCSQKCYHKSQEKNIIKVCKYCGKEFSQQWAKLYCSHKCHNLAQIKKTTKICPICKKTFRTPPSVSKKYCSEKCYGLSQRKRIKKICLICKKEFEVVESQRDAKYCSNKCRSIGDRGHIAWNRGLKRPKHSEKMKKENNPMWQGGISNLPYAFEFNKQLKELIRNRDNYKCQLCRMPEIENNQKLSIHHIDYDKKNCKPNNLITLCIKCNSKVNYNRDKWEIYFKKKIKEIMGKNKIQLSLISNQKEGKENIATFIQ